MVATAAPHVIAIETPGLGDRGYVVHDGVHALVIDPQRDTDRVERVLLEHGLQLTHVAETHVHNDYVNGGYQLARKLNAQYIVPGDVDLAYLGEANVAAVADGDTFVVGDLGVQVLHTPGHTPHHVSYAVSRDGAPGAVFTGGSLLYGTVGRPDLVSPDLTVKQAHDQWHSAHRLVEALDGDTGIFPTHGFGSFCSSIQTEGRQTSLGEERSINPALTEPEDAFVGKLLSGLDVFPAYYAHMGPANAAGPSEIDLSLPALADPAELRRRIAVGEWVVDLRSREVFTAGHVPGALNFDLDGAFINYLGWMIPWSAPVTLLGATTEQVAAAQRELVRIGIDRPAAHAVGGVDAWIEQGQSPSTIRRVTFADLRKEWASNPAAVVIDTRQIREWEGGHVDGAVFIAFYDVLDRMSEIPRDRPVFVYCGSGYRASAVSSLLQRHGFDNVIHVDDSFGNAAAAGLPIVAETTPDREPGWTWIASRACARSYEEQTDRADHTP
jgi:glyoxylase-like metal-dependent hydrolase (beta-lactamase superfamily II)/rhodanese-related sulfurtransferase